MRVSRGGSFAEGAHHSRTSDRMPQKPDMQPQAVPFTLGIRCAASAAPAGEASPVGETASEQVAESAPTSTPVPTPTPAAQEEDDKPEAPQGEAGPVEWVNPDNLDSYRANWLTKIKMPGQDDVMGIQYRLEWTKEPAAQHVWADMGAAPFTEAIWIEDEIWIKVGENWVKPQDQDAEQVFDNFHEAWETDDEMILVGEETVNGVNSKHYVYDFTAPAQGITIHREIWVADEGDLPEVPVRAILQMVNKTSQGTMTTEIEANITDINTPIDIEPPM
jgi:hypothetical protein